MKLGHLLLFLALVTFSKSQAGPSPISFQTIKGTPHLEKTSWSGFWLWQDKQGFHLRFKAQDKPLLFSGRLNAQQSLGSFERLNPKAAGWVRTDGDKTILFSATSRGGLDGFDLRLPGPRKLNIQLEIDLETAPLEQIRLGEKASFPKRLPLVVNIE